MPDAATTRRNIMEHAQQHGRIQVTYYWGGVIRVVCTQCKQPYTGRYAD